MQIEKVVAQVNALLSDAPAVRPGGSLLVMVGLPGAGKSSVVAAARQHMACTVVTTDLVRTLVRQRNRYTAAETAFVYEICYRLVEQRLAAGTRVIFDGSNYLAARRQQLYDIARRHGAALAVCHVQAAVDVTRQRLDMRMQRVEKDGDYSEAGWAVYQWMVEAQEPIALPHLTLDTTAGNIDELGAQLSAYWLAQEESEGQERNELDNGPARDANL